MNEMYRALARRFPSKLSTDSTIELVDKKIRRPMGREMSLEPLFAGVCGTDWQILRGMRDDSTAVLGHEGIARVAEDHPDYPLGTLVTVNPTHPVDSSFLLGHNCEGTWAERLIVPESAVCAGLVEPLPNLGRSDQILIAGLAEPLATVLYGLELLRCSSVPEPATIVVWGDGIVGQIARHVWKHAFPHAQQVVVGQMSDENTWSHLDPGLDRVLQTLPGPVHAIVVVTKPSTGSVVRRLETVNRQNLTIDIHSGLESDSVWLSVGVVNAAKLRSRNCGGLSDGHPMQSWVREGKGRLTVFGHRGVANHHLRKSISYLLDEHQPLDYIVTDVVKMSEAPEVINDILGRRRREHRGHRVHKLVVDMEHEA